MPHSKSRQQCVVALEGKFVKVKAYHVGQVVYDKKTKKKLGILIEQNPNTNMLRLRREPDGVIITLR